MRKANRDDDRRSPVLDHPNVVRVRHTLANLNATGEVVVLDEHVRTAPQAAVALDVAAGQIANSLVFVIPDDNRPERATPVLVLTSGAHRVDVDQVAGILGVERLERADPQLVRSRTGFPIGGVPPVGHLTPLRTLVDVDLASFTTVWAAAGHPRTVFPTRYDELLRITAGQPAEVG